LSASLGSDDESTIKVAPTKKDGKEKALKLKKSAPKQNKPGNWRDGSVIDGWCSAIESRHSSRGAIADIAKPPDDKKKGTDTPSTSSVPASPGPIVNQLDDSAKETFATGRPLEDTPKIQQCRHCKKSILTTAITAHVISCLKAKKEKAQRKKEQKEAREREKKGIDAESKKDEEGDTKMEDDDDAEDDASPEKKGPGGLKSTKKSAGKKLEIDDTKKGKKRKADGDAEKGPKQKKKKEEPKPKAPKPRGIYLPTLLPYTPGKFLISPLPGWLSGDKAARGHASAPGALTSVDWKPFLHSPSETKGDRSSFTGPNRPRGCPRLYPPKPIGSISKAQNSQGSRTSTPKTPVPTFKFIGSKRQRRQSSIYSPTAPLKQRDEWTRTSLFNPFQIELKEECSEAPSSKTTLPRTQRKLSNDTNP
jgi:hypothetical protein